jgi:hypothetical protein
MASKKKKSWFGKLIDSIPTPDWESAKEFKEGQDYKRDAINELVGVNYEKGTESKKLKKIKRNKHVRNYS